MSWYALRVFDSLHRAGDYGNVGPHHGTPPPEEKEEEGRDDYGDEEDDGGRRRRSDITERSTEPVVRRRTTVDSNGTTRPLNDSLSKVNLTIESLDPSYSQNDVAPSEVKKQSPSPTSPPPVEEKPHLHVDRNDSRTDVQEGEEKEEEEGDTRVSGPQGKTGSKGSSLLPYLTASGAYVKSCLKAFQASRPRDRKGRAVRRDLDLCDGKIHIRAQPVSPGPDFRPEASVLVKRDHYPEYIDVLVQQCMEWCDSYNLPLVVPLSSWLPDPRVPLVQTLEDPDDIDVVCPTHNGQHLFCATSRNEIRMYHIPSRKHIRTMTGHTGRVTCLVMAFKNHYLLSGSEDNTIRIWNVVKSKTVQVIREATDHVTCLALFSNDDVIIAGSRDHCLRTISMASGEIIHTRKEHEGPIVSVLLNSADTILASGSSDRTINIWDIDDMVLLNVIKENIPSDIISMGLTCDNTFLLIGCQDGSLLVKSFTTGSDIHKLEGHIGKVESMALSTDCYHAAVGCSDGNLYLYNLRTTELLDGFAGHAYSIHTVCCTSNQHFVITAAKDKVNVWTFYRRHTHTIVTDEHAKAVSCVNVSRDGKTAITGAKDKRARLWFLGDPDLSRARNPSSLTTWLPEEAPGSTDDDDDDMGIEYVDSAILAQRFRQASVGSETEVRPILTQSRRSSGGGGARVQWDQPVARLQVARESSEAEVATVNGKPPAAATQGANSTPPAVSVKFGTSGVVIDTGHTADVGEEADEANFPTSVYGADEPGKRRLPGRRASMWRDQAVSTDPFGGSELRRPSHMAGWVSRATAKTSSVVVELDYISRTSATNAKGATDEVVKLWNLDICDFSADLVGHEASVTAVALADEEAFAVSGSADGVIKVWSVMLRCVITDYREHSSAITEVQVLSCNERVLSVESQGVIKIWKAESGETSHSLSGPTSLLSITPNSMYAVSGENGNSMKIWSVEDGSVVQDITHNDTITCVAFSPDSRYLVTGSVDMSLKVWDVATGKLIQVLVEHENTVSCVAVTGDNCHIVSGSHDRTLLVWSLQTGAVEHRLEGHTDNVTVVKVTLDGSVAVSGSIDGTLRIWSVSSGKAITTFDLQNSVLDLHLTGKAAHIVVKLKESLHVPLLCLHNSPAGEFKSHSEEEDSLHDALPILPLKPQPPPNQRPSSLFPTFKPSRKNSVQSIPEIIKVAPMQVPLSQTIKAQEKKQRQKSQKQNHPVHQIRDVTQSEKKSSVCLIL